MEIKDINFSILDEIEDFELLFDNELSKREFCVLRYLIKHPNDYQNFLTFILTNQILPIKNIMKIYYNIFAIDALKKELEKENIKKNKLSSNYEYCQILKRYNKLLENWVICAKELNLKDSLDLSYFFTYLLWNGFFSIDHNHKYQNVNFNALDDLYSLSLMQGSGVCINYSTALKDFLRKFGYKSAVIINYIVDIKNIENHLSIVRKIESNKLKKPLIKLNFNFFNKLNGNHACTLINENENLYIYDSTNLLFFDIENPNKAIAINAKGELLLKILMSYRFAKNREEFDVLDKLIGYDNNETIGNSDLLRQKSNNCLEIILSNKSLLDDCYDDTKRDICFINEKVKLLKK